MQREISHYRINCTRFPTVLSSLDFLGRLQRQWNTCVLSRVAPLRGLAWGLQERPWFLFFAYCGVAGRASLWESVLSFGHVGSRNPTRTWRQVSLPAMSFCQARIWDGYKQERCPEVSCWEPPQHG